MLCFLLLLPLFFALPMALAFCDPAPCHYHQPVTRYYVIDQRDRPANPPAAKEAGR